MLPLGTIQQYMEKLDNWSLEGEKIIKDRQFGTFKGAIDFINAVAKIAESQEHHPDIIISKTRVRLGLTTRSEQGLTAKDFELAEQIDKIGKEETNNNDIN